MARRLRAEDRHWAAATILLFVALVSVGVAMDRLHSHARVEAAKSSQRSADKQGGDRQEQGRQAGEAPPLGREFHGSKHADPANCYAGEKEGECAARLIQERVAGFTTWLVFGTLGQLAVALFVGAATVYLGNKQAAISKTQAGIQQAVADLERPTLFVTSLGSVKFEPWKYPSDGTEQCQPAVQMRFANFGRTPAVLLAIEGEVFTTRKGSPPPPGWTATTHLPTHLHRFQIMATGEDKGATVQITGRPIPAAFEGHFQAKEVGAFVWGRFVYVDPFGARLETRYGLVPGEGGQPLPGNYAGHNEIRTYTRDDPDAPHRRYGA